MFLCLPGCQLRRYCLSRPHADSVPRVAVMRPESFSVLMDAAASAPLAVRRMVCRRKNVTCFLPFFRCPARCPGSPVPDA
ncbi:hypothetical protein CNY67_02640 [Desulfovibrio sp. G11]|nr:hypothetical protein CNY67_02640 [Desulfovibrio sp. G11]